MAKQGDRVRFLNATGGGVITRIEGKTAFVEDEDGFESPILLKDVVVVLPAGHEAAIKGSNILFDQKAFDAGKQTESISQPLKQEEPQLKEPEVIEESGHGNIPTLILAFEPANVKLLSKTKFTGVLINDSNYFIDFTFLKRSSDDRGWEIVFKGTVNPNELIDLVVLTHEELPEFGKVALQGVTYKKDKSFSLLPPINVIRKLDLTKFHKLHCFRESKYLDSPVLEYPLVTAGSVIMPMEIDEAELASSMHTKNDKKFDKYFAKELSKKYKVGSNQGHKPNLSENPNKLLPLIEVDLHIGELTDNLSGLEPKDMLEMQLSEVRKTMKANSRRIGQKIVFIHGKGEGVLRKAVLDLLKKEYPKAELQDASFREYGFGATLVTVH